MSKTQLVFPAPIGLGVLLFLFMAPNEARSEGLGRNFEPLWTYEFPGDRESIADFTSSGETGYVLTYSQELLVFDLTTPTTATLSGVYTPESANTLAVTGNLVFLAEFNNGIKIVDMADPSSPEFVNRIDADRDFTALHISGNLLFATARGNPRELRIFNITDPSNPQPHGAALVTLGAGYAVDGTHVYVHGSSVGIEVIDISDLDLPQWVTNFVPAGGAGKVIAASEVLYCAASDAVKILDPAQSGLVASEIDTTCPVSEFEVAGNLLVLTDGTTGFAKGVIHAFEISDRSNPRWLGVYSVNLANLLEISSTGRIFAITDEDGDGEMGLTELRIMNYETTSSPQPLQADLNGDGGIGPEDLIMMLQEGWYRKQK